MISMCNQSMSEADAFKRFLKKLSPMGDIPFTEFAIEMMCCCSSVIDAANWAIAGLMVFWAVK